MRLRTEVKLGEVLRRRPCYGIGAPAVPYQPSLPRYLRITDIDESSRFRPNPVVSVDSPSSHRYVLQLGDLVVARTGASVGKSYRYVEADGELVFAGFLICLSPDSDRLDSRYLGQVLQSKKYWDWVKTESTRSGQPGINARQLAGMVIEIPPLEIQRKISSRLDSIDKLVDALERLILKKQAIKQGMMQQLLTGKTRLPGFDGEWAQTSMGESGLFSGAGVDKTSNTGEPPVRLLNYVDVYHEEFVYPDTPRQMVTASTVKKRQCDIQAGDVFFTPTSETPDDIGRSAVSLQDAPGAVYSYHLVRWRPRDSWDLIFLGFAFNSEFLRSQVVALASGSGARYVISMPGFRSLKIFQPPVEEQAAIGRVLRDSSIQIEILKDQLTKVRSIKQGMMQELLAGRTRLLPAGESV